MFDKRMWRCRRLEGSVEGENSNFRPRDDLRKGTQRRRYADGGLK